MPTYLCLQTLFSVFFLFQIAFLFETRHRLLKDEECYVYVFTLDGGISSARIYGLLFQKPIYFTTFWRRIDLEYMRVLGNAIKILMFR